jgi:hypothetical protein
MKLLEAAAEIAGGSSQLAVRLGIAQAQLAEFMRGESPLPDSLLLQVVDIVLSDRLPSGGRVPRPAIGEAP